MSKRIEHLLVNISAQIGVHAFDEYTAKIGLQEHKLTAVQDGTSRTGWRRKWLFSRLL